jgi:hypothetical protein
MENSRSLSLDGARLRLARRAREGDSPAADLLFTLAANAALAHVGRRLGSPLQTEVDPAEVLRGAREAVARACPEFPYRDRYAFAKWLSVCLETRMQSFSDHVATRKPSP